MTVITRPDIKSLSETGGLLSILEQHLEEVHTLYNQRQDLVHSLSGTLPDILLLDNRIDANLDGLRCYHNAIDKLLDVLGESVDNGFIFTASILATETKNTELLKCILAKVESEHDSLPGLLSAYSWIPEGFTKALVPRLFSLSTIGQILALHLCQHHFIRAETQLEWALTQDNVNIQTAGLDTVSTLGLTELLPACRKLLASTDERVAMHAQRTCVLLEQNPSSLLEAVLRAKPEQQRMALPLLLTCLPLPQAAPFLSTLAKTTEDKRLLLLCAGQLGDPSCIPALLRLMQNAALARIAAFAFSFITGLDLTEHNMEGSAPAEFEAGPTDSPEDDEVASDPDEGLPWPDRDKLAQWWEHNGSTFKPGIRYLMGKEISREHCLDVLETGNQAQRQMAALHLKKMDPAAPLFLIDAPAWRQQARLAQLRHS